MCSELQNSPVNDSFALLVKTHFSKAIEALV